MSAGQAVLRRSLTPGAVLLGVIVLIASAVALGTRVAATRTLTGPSGDEAATGYARNAIGIGRLAPVSAKFTERRLGRDPTTAPISEVAPSAGPRKTTPAASPPARDDSIRGKPGTIPALAPGGFVLNLAIAPDKPSARAGDEVRYRMTITNTGTEDFRGRSFTLQWHTPTGTFGRNALDQCTVLPVALVRTSCAAQRLLFEPGLGEARHDTFYSAGLVAIRPGEPWTYDWYVQILPSATEGTTYLNHAHLMVSIDGEEHTISTDDVTVTVVA